MIAGSPTGNGGFVPRARAVTSVSVDGEAIICNAGSLHHLNRTATIVWECCDGDADLDTIVAELGAAFSIDPETARADIGGIVAELAAMDLLVPPTRHAPELDPTTATEGAMTVLVDPDEACASCADRPWAHNSAYMIGDVVVPVAVDDLDVGNALDAALADQLLAGVGPLTPYYAVVVPPPAGPGRTRGMYALQSGATVATQSRGISRVLRSLFVHLASHGDLAAEGLVAIPALVVAAHGRALAVPRPPRPVAFARALARRGLEVADAPTALIDLATREVVVGAPGLALDLHALESVVDTNAVHGHEPAPLAWGRYELAGLAAADGNPARALLDFAPPAEPTPQPAVAALVALIEDSAVVDAVDPDEIAAVLGLSSSDAPKTPR